MIASSSKTSSSPILSCRDLSIGYKDKAILSGVNLDFEPSCFISLLGPNGAGKTTLLRTLSRHLPPLGGGIELYGKPLKGLRQAELAKIMAVVLTDKINPPLFTAFQFAALGRYPHTDFLGRLTEEDEQVVGRSLAAVHAEDLAEREFTSLSDGERQKVLVARALAQEPQILLLDEPTAHLDLKHRVEVMAILRNLCAEQGITVVASLHDVDIAAKISDKVALVKDGGIRGWGSPEEVLGANEVADLYDFDTASFSRQLGSIELRGEGNREKVFVVGGMGCGATLFRLLAKKGYQVEAGVLFDNDLDYFVAESLQIPSISQPPAAAIAKEPLEQAIGAIKSCDWVVDAGCCDAGVYQNNLEIVKAALAMDKPVLSLGAGLEARLPSASSKGLVVVEDASQLATRMEQSK